MSSRGDAYVPVASAGQTQSQTIDEREWALRLRLAAAYRAVDYFGWSELTA
ncbi:MAG: hypothetical protein RI906_2490, partial [Pseudomonadota bacterium]